MLDKEMTPVRENAFTPEGIVQVLLRRLWTIVLVALVLTGSALGFSLAQTPTYEASIKILIGQKSTASETFAGNVTNLQALTLTMAKAVPSLPVAQTVVEQLGQPKGGAEEVLKNLSAQQEPGTMFIDVSYRDPDPKRAQLIANTVGQVFSQKVSEVSPGANAITATVWNQATLPKDPVSPNLIRNVILALVLGTVLGIGLAFLREYIDESWNLPEEVEQVSGVPTLGVIPTFENSARKKKLAVLARERKG